MTPTPDDLSRLLAEARERADPKWQRILDEAAEHINRDVEYGPARLSVRCEVTYVARGNLSPNGPLFPMADFLRLITPAPPPADVTAKVRELLDKYSQVRDALRAGYITAEVATPRRHAVVAELAALLCPADRPTEEEVEAAKTAQVRWGETHRVKRQSGECDDGCKCAICILIIITRCVLRLSASAPPASSPAATGTGVGNLSPEMRTPDDPCGGRTDER